MCNFGLNFFDKNINSAASPWRPAGASNGPQNRCAYQLVGRKVVRKKL